VSLAGIISTDADYWDNIALTRKVVQSKHEDASFQMRHVSSHSNFALQMGSCCSKAG
jgi:hypothetical protein